jgi:hypothetical protein
LTVCRRSTSSTGSTDLLLDIKANRAGMPDLIQFWPQDKTYRMIEVKGPGDRLQDNQLRWLEFCHEHQHAGCRLLRAMGGARRLSYSIAVRALCEFTAKTSAISTCASPRPHLPMEGMAGHRTVASRRSDGLSKPKSRSKACLPASLKVKGRADGYDPAQNCLEEIKTYRGDLSKQPANHRATCIGRRLKVYGWLMCQRPAGLSRSIWRWCISTSSAKRKPASPSPSTRRQACRRFSSSNA